MPKPPSLGSTQRSANGAIFKRLIEMIGPLLVGPQSRIDLARAVDAPDRDPDAVGRDVRALRTAGFAITDTRGKPYELDVATLPLWVTPSEMASLIAAQGLATQAKMPEATVLACLLRRIPPAVRAACSPQATAMLGDQAVDYQAAEGIVRVLRAAIARKRMVRVLYKPPNKAADWRLVDAARLVWVEGTLIFQGLQLPVCSDKQWQDVRDFRVDRIQTVEVREQVWQYPEVPTFRYAFRLPAERDYLTSDFPPQAIRFEPDGSFVVTLEESNMLRARRFVLRYGAEAEALEPPELVAELREIAESLWTRYGASQQ